MLSLSTVDNRLDLGNLGDLRLRVDGSINSSFLEGGVLNLLVGTLGTVGLLVHLALMLGILFLCSDLHDLILDSVLLHLSLVLQLLFC